MIIKSLSITLFLSLVYSLFISYIPTPSASQNQNQDNLVKAQKYMYAEHVPENVIVGTSLSCHILTDSLPRFYNLSFNGSSIYDGLYVILRREHLPKNVFIETNLYLNNKSELLSSQLFDIYPFYLSKFSSIFRFEHQPIGKIIFSLNPIGDKIVVNHNNFMKRVKEKLSKETLINNKKGITQDVDLFDKMLLLEIEKYNQIFPMKIVSQKLNELDSIVKILHKKKVNVYFFEMPINFRLMKSKRFIFLNNKLRKKFSYNVDYIKTDTTRYITSDCVHLKPEESLKYTHFFKSQLQKRKLLK